MKKLIVVLLTLAMLAVPMTAFAWGGGVNASNACAGVTVSANPENPYWEDSHLPNLVKWVPTTITGTGFFAYDSTHLTRSGVVTVTWQKFKSVLGIVWIPQSQFHTENYSWSKVRPSTCPPFAIPVTANVTFQEPTCAVPNAGWTEYETDKVTYVKTGAAVPGGTITVTATAKPGYVLVGQSVFTHTFVTLESLGCYETCDAVVDGTPGEWSEWVLNSDGDGYVRERTVPLLDSVDLQTVCGDYAETETKDAVFEDGFSVVNNCFGVKISQHFYRDGEEYLPPVVVEAYDWQDAYNDSEVFYAQGKYPEGFPLVYDEDPICPACSYEQQDYGLAELWGPSGQYATMYIYPDKRGNLPIGVGVERQKCVLGWVAVRSGAFDFVYKDTCTGQYYFNHNDVTPRPDVLKTGVCNRDGACLQ